MLKLGSKFAAAAGSDSLSRRRRPRARLARPHQPVTQLLLELGRRIKFAERRQRADPLEPEQPQEQVGGAVQDRAELGAAGLLDHPALEQRADR